MGSTVTYREDGHAIDVPEIPMLAVRELIANALVHRSLSPTTHGRRVDIRLSRDRLVIASPGGLYAVTTSQLGHPGGRSAPNEFLYAICQHSSAAARGRGEGDSTARGAHPAVGGRPRRDR